MRTTFTRTEQIETKTWDRMIDDLRNTLHDFKSGNVAEADAYEFLVSHISCQDEDGAWGLVKPAMVPSDARVNYYYLPTYISTAILIQAYFYHPEVTAKIGNFIPAFQKALSASLGRSFRGHGYEEMDGILEALRIFYDGGAGRMLNNTEICPAFSAMLRKHLTFLESALETGSTKSEWGQDYADEYRRIICRYHEEVRVIFVYGTLLKGRANHDCFMGDAVFLGEAQLDDYAVFDLGSYPAALPAKGSCVLGELYEVTSTELTRIDTLEAEGSLYFRKRVQICSLGKQIIAETYIYHEEIDDEKRIPFVCQPWGNNKYVWYACYGSNLLEERFLNYIKGGKCRFNSREYTPCSDPTPPPISMSLKIPFELYFGNKSTSWDNGGVAFLDRDRAGTTIGKAYLITISQYKHLREAEGEGADWYNEEITLGTKYGIPIRTITNHRRRDANIPSEKYREVIINGLLETNKGMKREEAEAYLDERS